MIVALAALAGCAESDSTDDQTTDGTTVYEPSAAPPMIDAASILADHAEFVVNHNDRAQNVPTHESARVWLMDYLASAGLEVYRHNFTAGGLEQANIVGIHWGQVRDQWVVIGGHYDTTDQICAFTGLTTCPLRNISQGAYDDGSGTMISMALAKAFDGTPTYYSIAFVAFDGEERGTQGAAAFVNDFVTGSGEDDFPTPYGRIKVVVDIDLDMIGLNWPGVNAPVNTLTNSEFLWQATLNKTSEMGFPEGQVIRKDALTLGSSDYARFWEVNEENGGPIPTIFFISGFEEFGFPAPAPADAHTPTPVGYYPFWHLEDTVETMTAMAGGQANLQAGFQSAADLAAHLLWLSASHPGLDIDAVPK